MNWEGKKGRNELGRRKKREDREEERKGEG